MAKSKFRPTAFTRFLLVMLIVVPCAWFGASYYNGEDPMATIKELVNKGENAVSSDDAKISNEINSNNNSSNQNTSAPSVEKTSENALNLRKKVRELESELNYQKRKNQDYEDEIEKLKKEVWKKDQLLNNK